MKNEKIVEIAIKEGFADATIIDTADIVFDASFRPYCEENLCGKYNANYSCPPDCGTVEELRAKTLAEDIAMILTTKWDIGSYENMEAIQKAKKSHNAAVLRLMDKLRKLGYQGFAAGYNGCPLCDPCKRILDQPCPFPDKRISCMSAYCINVSETAQRCGLEFAWEPGKLFLFGMIAMHKS